MTQRKYWFGESLVNMRKKIEKQLAHRTRINKEVEAALIAACHFAWKESRSIYKVKKERAKVVWSVYSMNISTVRDDHKMQCLATKSTYLAAKCLADDMTESYAGDWQLAVVAQYVDKNYIVND